MKSVVVFLAVLGATLAAPSREKRQIPNCVDPFKNVLSPCQNNPNNRVYFPHPTDRTKFLQCDVYNRMYIIQCPAGEEFVQSLTGCRPPLPVTNAPITATPFVPPVTARPFTQGPVSGNPCTAAAIARGQLYFPVLGDNTRFIECDLAGNPSRLTCPTNLLWDQGMLSCVYPINGGGVQPANPTSSLPVTLTNPCTASAINNGQFFFPHPDATKFIQCDMWGQSFVVSCPSNLIWNAYLETCFRAVNSGAVVNQG